MTLRLLTFVPLAAKTSHLESLLKSDDYDDDDDEDDDADDDDDGDDDDDEYDDEDDDDDDLPTIRFPRFPEVYEGFSDRRKRGGGPTPLPAVAQPLKTKASSSPARARPPEGGVFPTTLPALDPGFDPREAV